MQRTHGQHRRHSNQAASPGTEWHHVKPFSRPDPPRRNGGSVQTLQDIALHEKVDACKTAIQHALARSTRLQLSQSNCQWKFAALSAIALQTSGYRDKHHETWSFICFNICVFNFIMALSMVAIYKLQFKKTSGEVMADAVFRCPLVETPTSASIILLEPADSLALKVQESRRYFVANKLSCFPGRPEDESRKIMSQ